MELSRLSRDIKMESTVLLGYNLVARKSPVSATAELFPQKIKLVLKSDRRRKVENDNYKIVLDSE